MTFTRIVGLNLLAEINKAKTRSEGEVRCAQSRAPAAAPAKKLEEEGKKAVDDLKKKFGL